MFCNRLFRAFIVLWMCAHMTGGVVSAHEAGATDLGKVRVQLKWLHQFQFAGYYAAVEKGFYEEHGLDVVLVEGRPELNPVDVVLSGAAEYGVATPELLLDYAEGEPVVTLGVIFQHSPYVFLSTEASGITDISQLAGKRVMIEPQAAELYAYLKRERIPLDSLTILPHSFSAQDLLDGKVDAMSAYVTDEEYTLEKDGVPYFAFNPRASGVDFYGDLFFTTEAELEEHPERARAFHDATIEGWQYALEHTDEIIDLILAKYSTRKSREALVFEAAQMRMLMHPEIIPVGYMYAGRWQHIAETYQELGMLDGPLPLEGFLYETDPSPDYTWALWTSGIALAIALVAFGILLPLWRLNTRMRKEVAQRRQTEIQLYEAKAAAERANQVKAQFVASVTHDLRTPLNAILGLSDILHDKEQDPEKREHLETINKAGVSLLKLIDELLDLNRIESGRLDLVDKPFLLDDVLDDVAELLSVAAQRKGLELLCWVDPSLNGGLHGDAERLRQIFFNLGGNAVKFTDNGSISFSARADSDGWLRLTVQDTGPGIPEEIANQLFEPFIRSKSAKRKDGSGLGLSIVRRLAEAMGGTAEVLKDGSPGATFIVRLPIIDEDPGIDALELSRALKGRHICVRLKTKAQTDAALKNLASLGAKPTEFEDGSYSGCDMVVLDSSSKNSVAARKLAEQGITVVTLNPVRSLVTRRVLMRAIRAQLDSTARPEGHFNI